MTAQKPEKCCFFIHWKVVCYIFAYFILALQTVTIKYCVATIQYYFTRVNDLTIVSDSEILPEVILFLVFAGAIMIGIAIAVVVFTIGLLISLHKDNYNFIKKYLIFGTIMLVIFIIVSIVAELIMYKDHSASTGNSIAIVCNAYFLYVIRSYWLTLDSHPKTDSDTI